MIKLSVVVAVVTALAGCGKKDDGTTKDQKPVEVEKPVECPRGSVADKGACVEVVTAEKVTAVEVQKTRLQELADVLAKVVAMSAPVELLDGIRQTPQWKGLVAANGKLKIADDVVTTLNEAVKTARVVKDGLGAASTRLGNLVELLKAELARTGVTPKLEAMRTQVSTELRAALEPLSGELASALQTVIVPVTEQVTDAADLIVGACAMAKVSGGGDQLKQLCAKAKDVFPAALAFLQDLKTRPAQLLGEVTTQLETTLDQLVDTQTRAVLDAAQAKVNEVLKLPAAGPGAGSAAGAGSGSGSGSASP